MGYSTWVSLNSLSRMLEKPKLRIILLQSWSLPSRLPTGTRVSKVLGTTNSNLSNTTKLTLLDSLLVWLPNPKLSTVVWLPNPELNFVVRLPNQKFSALVRLPKFSNVVGLPNPKMNTVVRLPNAKLSTVVRIPNHKLNYVVCLPNPLHFSKSLPWGLFIYALV